MSEVPYDPTGRIQQATPGYAQNKVRPGAPGSGPAKEGTGAIITLGVLSILYGLNHMCVGVLAMAVGGTITAFSDEIMAEVNQEVQAGGSADPEALGTLLSTMMSLLLVFGVVFAIIGLVASAGSIGLFMRKNWGRLMVFISSIFAGLEAVLLGALFGYSIYLGAPAQDLIGAFTNLAFVLAFSFLGISVLRKYSDQFT